MARNPFSPTLGKTPPLLAGRQDVLDEIDDALASGPGAHERVTILTGMRGIGKTVVLNAVEDLAQSQHGWLVLSETGTEGYVERLRDAAIRLLAQHNPQAHARLSELGLFGVTIGIEHAPASVPPLDIRGVLTELLNALEATSREIGQEPVGLLITLDELHHQRQEETRRFAAAIQHLIREDREIAVVMAGIPSAIQPLLQDPNNDNPITFLRRANKVVLGRIADAEVRRALKEPVEAVGARWDPEALDRAVAACDGYPFLIQLVGRWSFHYAQGEIIDTEAVERGTEKARRKMGSLVHEPALADLSDIDRTFLAAMARDDGPSKVSDIAARMHVSAGYASRYRARLIDAEMIEPADWGEVRFTLPSLRDYLREHAAHYGLSVSDHPEQDKD